MLTMGEAVFPPETIPGPFQLKVTPGVVDDAVMVPLVTEHVSINGRAVERSGGVTVDRIVTEAVEVHPLAGSVTVRV